MRLDETSDQWWKSAIVYCLDVETFLDSDGDGVGDFHGLTRQVDYLAGLGVTCIWLMPFQPSPQGDDGYEITDYYGVDPRPWSRTSAATTSSRSTLERSPHDPSVAYDRAHDVWLISSIPILPSTSVPTVFVSRSIDGGLNWGNPVSVASPSGDLDKNWTACDNTSTSPFYGHCYTTFDDYGDGDRLKVSTSTDGGATGGSRGTRATTPPDSVASRSCSRMARSSSRRRTPRRPASIAYRSTDGGATWGNTVSVSPVTDHTVAGGLRSGALPSAEISQDGTVYVAWADCRFRRSCRSNDIVYSKSSDGLSWSSVARVPIDTTNSSVDHFIPGLAVTGSGPTTRLGLTYYFYGQGRCGSKRSPCQLEVGYIESRDAGATWSIHTDVAGPFGRNLIANTSQGLMVGDYISTSWLGGTAFGGA